MPTLSLETVKQLTNIAEIEDIIDASYKSNAGTAQERAASRQLLWKRKAEVLAELDKRPKLKSAEAILDEMTKPRKKFRKAKFAEEIIVICGSTNWTDKSRIRLALQQIPRKDICHVVIGTSKGAEQTGIVVAKALTLSVVQMHPQQHLGNSAIHIRNNEVFRLLKPTRVIAFHNNIEASTSTTLFLKLGKKKGIPSVLITKQDNAKSIAKKMKVTNE